MKRWVLALCLLSSGCELIIDEAYDCLDNDKPEFDVKTLPEATLNEEYSAEITAYLVREPNDSWYQYEFELDGDLPQGVELITADYSRTALIYGVPTEYGDFKFNLKVRVFEPDSRYEDDSESYDDGDDLCSNTVDRDYHLVVSFE